MLVSELAAIMFELFQGRLSAYALKKEINSGSKVFFPDRNEDKDLPFTTEVLERHLKGEISIGVYTIDENDLVKWVCVDFDGKRGNPLEDAKQVKKNLLNNLGIFSWMERSQGGKGIHLWIFIDQKIPASLARKVISNQIPEFAIKKKDDRNTSFDMLFPNQDTVGSGYGNLCGLPLNGPDLVLQGRTVFIDDDGHPFKEQSAKLVEIQSRITPSAIFIREGKKIPDRNNDRKLNGRKQNEKIPGGFKLLSDLGCEWLKSAYERAETLSEEEWFAAIGQFAQLENGRAIAHKFSSPYPGYTERETDNKFDTELRKNMPMRVDTIQERFGEPCGENCTCAKLGLRHPYDLAKVPLDKLEVVKRGTYIAAREIAEVAFKVAGEIEKGERLGFPWGHDIIDDNTELRPKNLIILAARRSVGKTAAMIDAVVRGASKGIPQYVLSWEMSNSELGLRLISRTSEVDNTLIIKGHLDKVLWQKLEEGRDRLQEYPIFIDDTTRNLDHILDSTGELIAEHGQGCVWLDYLQLIPQEQKETQKQAVDRALKSFRRMARILEVPVIALAQLNRGEETMETDDELDSWLKDSGNIEQDADAIHYLRGKLGPGTVLRKWRLHKDRHRASGLNFKFELNQGIFKMQPEGTWNEDLVEENEYELGRGLDEIS